jgi:subtilisin family serine protease
MIRFFLTFLSLALMAPIALTANLLICELQPGTDPQQIANDFQIILRDNTEPAPFYLYEVPKGRDPHEVQLLMRQDPRVVWVEDDQQLEMPEHSGAGRGSTIGVIGDPRVFYEQNLFALKQIKWVPGFSFTSVRRLHVAVLDTGLSPLQPLLWSRVMASLNAVEPGEPAYDSPRGTDSNLNGIPDEGVGHGTMVAGIIADTSPQCNLIIVRSADSDGLSTAWWIVKGIAFSVLHGAKVINISLGSLDRVPSLSEVTDWVEARNAVIVAAAGNNGRQTQFHPASLSKVVSVTGVDPLDRKASFANWDSSVDVCAPATGIKSYWWDGTMGV